jgi:DNA polymerase epsilon subunit 2
VHITEHLVKSLLDQGHLCPLALSTRPILWEYDNALRLYPLPDVVVLADHCDHYSWRYEGCRAVNPGSFPVDFTFMVYRPATGDVEFSRID